MKVFAWSVLCVLVRGQYDVEMVFGTPDVIHSTEGREMVCTSITIDDFRACVDLLPQPNPDQCSANIDYFYAYLRCYETECGGTCDEEPLRFDLMLQELVTQAVSVNDGCEAVYERKTFQFDTCKFMDDRAFCRNGDEEAFGVCYDLLDINSANTDICDLLDPFVKEFIPCVEEACVTSCPKKPKQFAGILQYITDAFYCDVNIDRYCTSATPTRGPTISPTMYPTSFPSTMPTRSPTETPTISPSSSPSINPTPTPSTSPSTTPSTRPSISPSTIPSATPSLSPSTIPSTSPSISPSITPSRSPEIGPTLQPTESAIFIETGPPTASNTISTNPPISFNTPTSSPVTPGPTRMITPDTKVPPVIICLVVIFMFICCLIICLILNEAHEYRECQQLKVQVEEKCVRYVKPKRCLPRSDKCSTVVGCSIPSI